MAVATVAPESALQFAEGFLKYLGVPATSASDPRLRFLVAWENHEGTAATNNALAITNAEGQPATPLPGNSAGVQQFKTAQSGYVALHKYLINQGITGILQGLTNPASTVQSLTSALSAAHWEGSATPQALAASQNYANSVGRAAGGPAFTSLGTTGTGAAPVATAGATAPAIQGMNQQYAGPGAYKGFDLSSLAPDLVVEAKNAINEFLTKPGAEQSVMNDIYKNYSQESWAANNPEVRTLLVVGSLLGWDKDPAIFQGQLVRTQWWKSTSDNLRNWQETQANDPGQAAQAINEAGARVTNIANSLGVQLDAATLKSIATTVASQSVTGVGQFSNTAYTDQQIYQQVTAHFNSQDFLQQVGGTSSATPATAMNSAATATSTQGDAATLYNAFQTIARNYYLNWTPQQIAGAVQNAIAGDTGQGNFQSGAVATFTTTARNAAQQMYPGLASVLGTTSTSGTDNTPYQALSGYRTLIANYTGFGGDPDTIDMTNPQWSWILSGKPPPSATSGSITPAAGSQSPTAAPGTLPSYDQVQQYLMGTPQFQSTDQAKTMGWQVGSAITKAFGF